MIRRPGRSRSDALLDGAAPEGREPDAAVADLLGAARGPALPDELAGRVAALDAFLAVRATGAFAAAPTEVVPAAGAAAPTEVVPAAGAAAPTEVVPAAPPAGLPSDPVLRTTTSRREPLSTSTRRVGRAVGALVLGVLATGAVAVAAVAGSQPSGPPGPAPAPSPEVVMSTQTTPPPSSSNEGPTPGGTSTPPAPSSTAGSRPESSAGATTPGSSEPRSPSTDPPRTVGGADGPPSARANARNPVAAGPPSQPPGLAKKSRATPKK